MTEEEELRLALEESMREADVQKAKNTAAAPQWSNAVRQTSSTSTHVQTPTQTVNASAARPKVAPAPAAAVVAPPPSVPKTSQPARLTANPWGSTPASVLSASPATSATTQATALRPPSGANGIAANHSQTASNTAPAIPTPSGPSQNQPSGARQVPSTYAASVNSHSAALGAEESEQFVDPTLDEDNALDEHDELVTTPISGVSSSSAIGSALQHLQTTVAGSPTSGAVLTPVKPIARPQHQPVQQSTQHNSQPGEILAFTQGIPEALDATLMSDSSKVFSQTSHDALSTMSTSTMSSGLSSPVTSSHNFNAAVTIQLHEMMARILKLESENQFVVSRMKDLVGAYAGVEQAVAIIANENNSLKAQLAELKTQVASSAAPTTPSASNPLDTSSSLQFYSPFYSLPAYSGMPAPPLNSSLPSHFGTVPPQSMNAPFTTNGYLG